MLIRTNVTNIGDPFIVLENNVFYMYATDFDVQGFKVRKSTNLKDWEEIGTCLDLSDSWAYKDFWAPEVIKHEGKFYMHYTARRKKDSSLRMGVAIADNPAGPFKDVYNGPFIDYNYASIDGHVFIDDDGKHYFYYSRDCSENINYKGEHISEICVTLLNNDLTEVISEPIILFGPDRPYDSIVFENEKWNEGPFVMKKDGVYYLTYSANFFGSRDYCICLAKANNPLGPFEKCDDVNPILKCKELGEDFAGPGHNMFFKDQNGNLKMACHIQTDEYHPSGNRKAIILDAKIADGTIKFEF